MRLKLLPRLLPDLRELFDVLALYGEADAASLHGEIHNLGEIFELGRRREGAIIGAGVAATRRLARELHETHRGHHFLLQNAHAHFGIFFFGEFVAEIFAHEAYIAVNGLYPSLAPSFFGYPFCIGAQIDELAECIVGKIFLLSSASFRTRSGISICAARSCARLSR